MFLVIWEITNGHFWFFRVYLWCADRGSQTIPAHCGISPRGEFTFPLLEDGSRASIFNVTVIKEIIVLMEHDMISNKNIVLCGEWNLYGHSLTTYSPKNNINRFSSPDVASHLSAPLLESSPYTAIDVLIGWHRNHERLWLADRVIVNLPAEISLL